MVKKSGPKAKKPVKKKSKRLLPAREHVIMILLAVIGLFALCYFAFTQYQVSQEKKAFADAEIVLTQLSKDIEAKLGPPTSSETIKSCGYSSAKFSKGTLSCSVGVYIFYNTSRLPITSLGAKIVGMYQNNEDISATFSTLNEEPVYGYIGNDFIIKSTPQLHCGTTIRELDEFEKHHPGIIVSVSCSKDSKKEYFPVKD